MAKPDLLPAMESLRISRNIMRTNEPINRREGNIAQANLERSNAKSYQAAMGILRNAVS